VTPAVIWFCICANYFPRNAFIGKDIHQLVQETFEKMKEIVPDFTQRILKYQVKPDSGIKPLADDDIDSLFLQSLSQASKEYTSNLPHNEHKTVATNLRTPNANQKTAYTEEDDEWIIETRRFIQDSFTKLQQENLIPFFSEEDIKNKPDLLWKIDLEDLINLYEKYLYTQEVTNDDTKVSLEQKVIKTMEEEDIINKLEFDPNDTTCDIRLVFPEDEKIVALMERRQSDNNNRNSASTEQQPPEKEGQKTTQKTRGKSSQEDTVCQICNDGDYTDEDNIVFCSVRLLLSILFVHLSS